MTVQEEREQASAAKSDPPRAGVGTMGLESLRVERGRTRRWRRAGALGLAVALAALGAWSLSSGDERPRYETAVAERGALAVAVNASGRLEAREIVDVGAEVSGRIVAVHADFNDRVESGQLLAEIDTERLRARVDEAKAALGVAQAEAESARWQAEHAEHEHARARELFDEGLSSQQQLAAAALADGRARAGLASARARARVAAATLEAAAADVERARILAPIDGVVLARNVEPGQTLASAFQVPVLFKIARDLRSLELLVAVDEADVGKVRSGQRATFTVESHPDRTFVSRVVSVRNMPTVEQGVVTYEAVLEVDNREELLRPGMTATATIVTDELSDVLLVPNAALRFVPPSEADKLREEAEESAPATPDTPRHRVWTLREGEPVALAVQVGRSDGHKSEVTAGDLSPDTTLLVDVEEQAP